MENKFNKLTSKEWLPFQKSWSVVDSDETLYRDNLRFFTLPDKDPPSVYYLGPNTELFEQTAVELGLTCTSSTYDPVQFAVFDIRKEIDDAVSVEELLSISIRMSEIVAKISNQLVDRRFVCIFAKNRNIANSFVPIAWDLGKMLSRLLSLKDEKIICEKRSDSGPRGSSVSYALYARKDGQSPHVTEPDWNMADFQAPGCKERESIEIPSWFVLKPPRRRKGEVLHPAKYPESLAEMFISAYSNVGDNIFDPMSGTGSTQMAAIGLGRNGYGTELSPFFAQLAIDRLTELSNPAQGGLFETENNFGTFRIENADARRISELDFPSISYACTSPPYWDMLNMKGAENQAKRIEQGLQTNYSDDQNDLGNVQDYSKFLSELTDVYRDMFKIMEPGSHFTFVVKNIKKQGASYPFAWDLAHRLSPLAIPIAEHFWLQDDLSIAPYGYGNTWVSNTFHQYCITVQLKT